jgi:hypothetical protein
VYEPPRGILEAELGSLRTKELWFFEGGCPKG